MTTTLLQQALDALENFAYHGKAVGWVDVATSIREHLTQPEPRPIAWANINKHGDITRTSNKRDAWAKTPLYAAQPAPVPLTDEQIDALIMQHTGGFIGGMHFVHLARAAIAKFCEVNGIAASPEVPK
jgi:hypothetical protein